MFLQNERDCNGPCFFIFNLVPHNEKTEVEPLIHQSLQGLKSQRWRSGHSIFPEVTETKDMFFQNERDCNRGLIDAHPHHLILVPHTEKTEVSTGPLSQRWRSGHSIFSSGQKDTR